MNEKQLKAVWLLVQGFSDKVIAEELKITEKTLEKWKKQEDFKQEYDKAMRHIFKELSAEATATMADLMRNSTSQNVRLQACKDILSRGGYDAKNMQEIEVKAPEAINITIVE